MSSVKDLWPAGLVHSSDAALAAPPAVPLSRRLIVTFFSTALLLLATAGGILYWATISALQSADDQVVEKRAAVVLDILQSENLNEGLLAHEVNEDNQGPRQILIRVVTPDPQIAIETEGMGTFLKSEAFPDVRQLPLLEPRRATITLADGRSYRGASLRANIKARPQGGPAILQVATDTSLDNDTLAVFRRILFWVLGAAIPLCALTAWLVVKRGLAPLGRITEAAKAIDGATIDKRLSPAGLPAELHELASQFNLMLGRLEATWSDLRHYADTIAHELRTPLNRMRLDCELALTAAKTSDDLREVLTNAAGECDRLSRLLQRLLFLARADSKQASISPAKLALDKELSTIADYHETDAEIAGLTISAEAEPGLFVKADRELLQQAVSNLVSNAIAHTPAGGSIKLKAERLNSEAVIHVIDTGTGIPAEHHPRLFDRFYRAGAGDTAERAGGQLGLGLAIVYSIVALHQGRISVESGTGRGTHITLALPQA